MAEAGEKGNCTVTDEGAEADMVHVLILIFS